MNLTPKLQIPYVEATDVVADYPAHSKARADRLEKLMLTPTRTTNVFTAANNWTVTSSWIDVLGAYAFIFVVAQWKGASLPVSATGDISNEWVGTFDNSKIKFQSYGPLVSFNAGRVAIFYIENYYLVIQAGGGPTQPITTGTTFNITGVGLIEPSPTLNP
jgi:hypothetical protein